MDKQTIALRHAKYLESIFVSEDVSAVKARLIAAELRRLHSVNYMLQLALRDLLNDSEPCDCAPDDRHCPVAAARDAIAKAGETNEP